MSDSAVWLTGAISCAAMGLLFLLVLQSDLLDGKRKKLYLAAVAVTALGTALDTAGILLSSAPSSYRIPNLLVSVVMFSISPFLPFLMACVVEKQQTNIRPSLFVPWGVLVLFSILSIWFPFIFQIDAENHYTRESTFWLYVVVYAFYFLHFIRSASKGSARYPRRTVYVLRALVFFIVAGMSSEVFAPGFPFMWLTASFSMFVYYAFLCEQSNRFDILTDLYNRRTYENELVRLETKDYAAVVFLDVNRFKKVNDTYGHAFGDVCLNKLATIIREVFDGIGDCYRIGGDEFCLISRTASAETIKERLEVLSRLVDSAKGLEPRLPTLSAGFGVYRRNEGNKPTDAVREADRRLYDQKNARKRTNPGQGNDAGSGGTHA